MILYSIAQGAYCFSLSGWPHSKSNGTENTVTRNSRKILVMAGVAVLSQAAAPTFAHHSAAMFDAEKMTTLEGTVRDFQWTNPHIWIELMVKDATGKDVDWSIEGQSVNNLARRGWQRVSLRPGDKAVAVIHPLKSGGSGGALVNISVGGPRIGETGAAK
jgi:hypothetical protein